MKTYKAPKSVKVTVKVRKVIAGSLDTKATEVQAVTRWCETVEELLDFALKYGVTLAWHEARSAIDSGEFLLIDADAREGTEMQEFWDSVGSWTV